MAPSHCDSLYTVLCTKQNARRLVTTLANVHRLSKFVHRQISKKNYPFKTMIEIYASPQLRCYIYITIFENSKLLLLLSI